MIEKMDISSQAKNPDDIDAVLLLEIINVAKYF